MSFIRKLTTENMRRKPGRTVALVAIAAFLAMTVFGGSVVIRSLRNGLTSYEQRLGADVVAVPYAARTKGSFESILLQGIPGTFYMDGRNYDRICEIEGVEAAAPEFYLASASAGCCSVPVQIIGFDPEKDFTVQPWIRESYADSLGDNDILVGADLTPPKDHMLTFYGTPCRVVGQLARTGTGLDTAVYANMNTIRNMIANAQELGFHAFDDADVNSVSAVMVRVAEGYRIEDVVGDINIHVRKVKAASSANMLSEIAAGLRSVSGVIGLLMVVIWVLAVVVLGITFAMISRERVREFAVLRVAGASQKMVTRLVLSESALMSFLGGLIGVGLASLAVFPFGSLLADRLELPYLVPGAGTILILAAAALVLAAAAGAVTAALTVRRINQREIGLMLREDV